MRWLPWAGGLRRTSRSPLYLSLSIDLSLSLSIYIHIYIYICVHIYIYREREKERYTYRYWLLRNSWGPEWGDMGLFRVKRGGSSSCLLEQWMAVPEVASEVATCDDTPWLGLHTQKDLFRCRGMKGGSVCEVTCQVGYRLMPQEGLRCEPTGRWSTAWCEPLPCKEPPSVEHRLLPVTGETCTTNTLEEPICPVECVAGYESSGDALCVAGKWAVQPVCVPSLCSKPPEIAHAGTYVYIYIYTHLHLQIYIYIHTHLHLRIHIYIYTHIYVYICV